MYVLELSLPALVRVLAYCEDGLDELRHIGSAFVSPEIDDGQHVALAAHCWLFRLFLIDLISCRTFTDLLPRDPAVVT